MKTYWIVYPFMQSDQYQNYNYNEDNNLNDI